MLKLKNDALRDDVAAGRHVGCTSKQSVSQCVSHHRLRGRDNAASPRLADTAERDYFTLRERLITMQNNWKEPRSILMSSADRYPYRWATHAIIVSNTHALPRSINAQSNKKTEQSIYECLLGFCFNNIFCAATNFGCIDSFLAPIPETKKWWVMVSFGATAAGLFWTVNVCWAHPVISRPCSSE